MFNLWQSILRGSGVITGCRRCADVCPVGADFESMLRDVLERMPEDNEAKQQRLALMTAAEVDGQLPSEYDEQQRWIGSLAYQKPEAPLP